MGGALEAGKIVATVWLHNNWKRAGYAFKIYLIPAIIFLMLLTSMGIFGFLSKAHSDQSLVTGDAGSKVAIYDEKIQTARGNIDANRKALKQMDEAVDQVMGRSTDEKGADKAVSIRRGQQKERARLLAEITAEQKTISSLSEERAPYAADLRKVEAEVGPIKYIAAFIYGDEASNNMLEAAVRWVIILIVIVFDPLALTLILAANKQLEWAREGRGGWVHEEKPKEEEKPVEEPKEPEPEPVVEQAKDPGPEPIHCPKCNTQIIDAPGIGPCCPNKECDVFDNILGALEEQRLAQEQKELEEFFLRGKLIARGLDADEDARTAEEANAKLAEIETEDPDLDTIAAQAQEIKAVEKERDDLIEALIMLSAERDSVQQQLDQAHVERTSIAEELEQTITGLYASEGFLTVAEEEKEILRGRVTELETQATQQQEWIEQLEQDLREAIQLAHDKTQELNALSIVQNAVDDPLEQELSPPVITRDNTVRYQDKSYNLQAFNTLFPDLAIRPDSDPAPETQASFGTEFPKNQKKGDMFLRVDYLPSRLYKWNGVKWIETDKAQTDRYAYDQAYIKLLVEKIQRGEYDPEDLNDTERQQVADYLKNPPDA